jgi:hypothetical protein
MPETHQDDRRELPERRQQPPSPFSRYAWIGRRKGPRRSVESWGNYYVDQYPPLVFGVIIAVLSLCILDAFFTLHLIEQGAQEVNPVMRHFLEHGPMVFLVTKYALTGSALVLLLINKNFYLWRSRLRADFFFIAILILYALLIGYELVLIFRL